MEKHLSQLEIVFVRETMMKQQAMYNEQVRELHRVYKVQRTLLEEGSRNNWGSLKGFLKMDVPKGPSPTHSLKEEPDKQGNQPKRRFRFDLEKLPDEQSDEDEVEVEAAGTSYGSAQPARTLFTTGEQRQGPMKQENDLTTPHWLSQVLEKTRNGCWNTRTNTQETNRLQSAAQNGVLQDFDFLASSKEAAKQETETQVESKYPSWTLIAASNNCEYPAYTPAQSAWPGLQRGFYSSQIHQPSSQQQQQHCYKSYPWQAGTSGHFSTAPPSSTFTWNGVLQDGHWLRGNFTLTTPGVEGSFKVSYPGLTDEFQKEAQPVYKNGYHGIGELEKLGDTRKQDADSRSSSTRQGNEVGGADGYIMSEEEAASVVFSMASEASPPIELENSVAWFAEAIPTVSQEQEEAVDEFELATLQLKPVRSSSCVTRNPTKPTSVVEAGDATRDNPATVRPRRRCKKKMDFQKETLPSMLLLSRQEITEDLQVMGGLVRSMATTRDSSGGWETTMAHQHRHQACQRRKSAKCSPVSTLDVSRSPKRRSSAAAGAGFKVAGWGSKRKRNWPRRPRTSFACFGYLRALSSGNPVSIRSAGGKQR